MTNINASTRNANLSTALPLKLNPVQPLISILLFALLFLLGSNMANAQDVLAGLTSNGGPEGRGTAFTVNTSNNSFSIVKSFADWGIAPNGSLLAGDDGNFYGMTSDGGTYGHTGTVFMLTPAGTLKILKQFDGINSGSYAFGELTKGADGSFYGLTSAGGANSYGTAFKITSAGVYTLLKSFVYGTDGGNPRGRLALANDGNFYGLTNKGGANGYGTIFRMTPAGTVTVIRSFTYATDGGSPYGGLVLGKDGALYGMTYWGGANGDGTLFKITTAGTFTVLRHLKAATDGGSSQSELIQATDGNFYGMTNSGGANGNGTIFKLTTSTGAYTVIKALGATKDGGNPYGNLMQNTDGFLYGMTRNGGSGGGGTIFKTSTAGTFTVIHNLIPATEGSTPNGGLTRGTDGQLYGCTSANGPLGGGTAFKVTTAGTLTVLASFNGAAMGNAPFESLTKGKDSAYYGTNSDGGANGNGSIFKVCGNTVSTLFSFTRNTTGGIPKGSLIQATDGNFYGTTTDGGSNGAGTIFRITPAGTFTVIRHLKATTDGGSPQGSLVQAADGFLYGMTNSGGPAAGGTIFKINTSGSSFTILKSLAYATEGSNPEGNLIIGADGALYGLTSNNAKAFKITTAGVFTLLHSFVSGTEGSYPLGSLVLNGGNYYGTTSSGGTYGYGTIFKMTPAGTVTVLKHFNAATDGRTPKGSLLVGSTGLMYGMTSLGGTYNAGTLFRITTGGTFTLLRHFDLIKDGGNPYGSLILAPKNNLVATPQSVTVQEDKSVTITLSGTGGSPLTYGVSVNPLFGKVTGSGNTRTYTPNLNYNGADQFSFRVSVGCMASPSAIVSINVTAVADTPVLANITSKTVVKGSKLSFTAAATDGDAGQKLTFSLIGAPSGATINATSGAFSWTPSTAGSFNFKVRVSDNGSPVLYDEQQVAVTVTEPVVTGFSALASPETSLAVEHMQVSLFPNPVTDKLFVTHGNISGKVNIRIVGINGAVASNNQYNPAGKNRLELNVTSLKAGIYFVQMQNENGWQSYKFVKN
ncbi:choice-of-anchor tandem repeat GloVer-containing protein [Foetidibacter luteolus]|uniref:choice-of-anchor tandem repeat GloVer-containing protein n=1 Tax=Foetidibacter luteolus TaxID=2608880 RepID=UPI001A97F98E|nr:choice-of-anchor tandem repeat GloVer-containing protein [Foetidibacter luteolus]